MCTAPPSCSVTVLLGSWRAVKLQLSLWFLQPPSCPCERFLRTDAVSTHSFHSRLSIGKQSLSNEQWRKTSKCTTLNSCTLSKPKLRGFSIGVYTVCTDLQWQVQVFTSNQHFQKIVGNHGPHTVYFLMIDVFLQTLWKWPAGPQLCDFQHYNSC